MREGMARATSKLLQTSLVSLYDASKRLKQLSKVLKHRKAIDIAKDRNPGQPKQLRSDLENASLILSREQHHLVSSASGPSTAPR